MKTWDYDEITKISRKAIRNFVQVAVLCPNPGMRAKYIDGAFGAYVLWENLTGDTGDQQESDKQEFITLMRSLDPPE